MAIYSKKEFAEKCGIITKALSVYISRGKVVLTGDSIDDNVGPNASFLKKMSERKKPESKLAEVKETKKAKPVEDPDSIYRYDKDFKQSQIKKLQREEALLGLKQLRLTGKLLPTDLMKDFMARHFKSIIVANKQGMDEIVLEFSKKAKMNRNEIAELKGHILRVLNKTMDNSIAETDKELKNIILAYSQSDKE